MYRPGRRRVTIPLFSALWMSVRAEDPRKPALATLTGSFERFWYGGRLAGESDYQRADQIATALISGAPAASSIGTGGGAPQ